MASIASHQNGFPSASTCLASDNMYRVGDHVFFEMIAGAPYQIRKIEELLRNSSGSVLARVSCYFRRKDLTLNLLQCLEKEQTYLEQQRAESILEELDNGETNDNNDSKSESIYMLTQLPMAKQEHVRLCEVFPSNKQEVLQATHIRGKCRIISLQDEVEFRLDFAEPSESTFYFSRKYDPDKKTLKPVGEKIRVGTKWQAEIPELVTTVPADFEHDSIWETPSFIPYRLPDHIIEDFLLFASSVGLLARGSVHSCALNAIAASTRTATKQAALELLHKNDYDFKKSIISLAGLGRPILFRDELEDWTPSETAHFAQLLDKHGKMLAEIRKLNFPTRSMPDIVSFYYLWKTTDRYISSRQRQAQTRNEGKLKQIFIPLYTRISPAVVFKPDERPQNVSSNSRPCDSCKATQSVDQCWFSLDLSDEDSIGLVAAVQPPLNAVNSNSSSNNPVNVSTNSSSSAYHQLASSMSCLAANSLKLCKECWHYWKIYAGLRGGLENFLELKNSTQLANYPQVHLNGLTNGNEPSVIEMSNNSSSLQNSCAANSFACPIASCRLVLKTKATLDRHIELVHSATSNGCINTLGIVASASSLPQTLNGVSSNLESKVNSNKDLKHDTYLGVNNLTSTASISTTISTFTLYLYPFDRSMRNKLLSQLTEKERKNIRRLARNPFSSQLSVRSAKEIYEFSLLNGANQEKQSVKSDVSPTSPSEASRKRALNQQNSEDSESSESCRPNLNGTESHSSPSGTGESKRFRESTST